MTTTYKKISENSKQSYSHTLKQTASDCCVKFSLYIYCAVYLTTVVDQYRYYQRLHNLKEEIVEKFIITREISKMNIVGMTCYWLHNFLTLITKGHIFSYTVLYNFSTTLSYLLLCCTFTLSDKLQTWKNWQGNQFLQPIG